MKCLFIGNTDASSTSQYYFHSLLRLGHCAIAIDPEVWTTRHWWERLRVGLTHAPAPTRIEDASCYLVELCKYNKFDVVFVMAENFIPASTYEEIRNHSNHHITFVYHSHDNNFAPGVLKPNDFEKTLTTFDFVFTTKSQNVSRYRALGQSNSFFLPSAFEPTVHHPISDTYSLYPSTTFPVSFVGTYDHSRDKILEQVGWDRLEVWGDGWVNSPHYKKNAKRIHPNAIYNFHYADVTSHTSCALGLLREEAEDRHTQRTLEIPACGALQFTPKNDEILSFFEENKEIICFESLPELKDKVDFYLRNESTRLKVARRGHERVLKEKHTYQDRVLSILNIIGEKRSINIPLRT